MLKLTQEDFEAFVPSFRDCENRTYKAIEPYMEDWREKAYKNFELESYMNSVLDEVKAYIYRNAAYEALPHLDLVLTDNGFAVVNNNNLVPASRDRVAALQERLREEKSLAHDLLLFKLYQYGWRAKTRTTLLWCPMLCRRYGVNTADGKTVYEREYFALLPQVQAAHAEVARMVSAEQMDWLLEHQDEYDLTDTTGDARIVLREHCRRLMSALITGRRDSVRALTTRLQEFLNLHAAELPEYNGSTKYQADHFTPYENGKNDPCFFFG